MIAPPKDSNATKPNKASKKQTFSAMRLVIWGCVGLLVAAVAFFVAKLLSSPDAPTARPGARVSPVAPVPSVPSASSVTSVSSNQPPATVKAKPVEPPKPVPPGNVMTARTAKAGRVMTLMDGTVVTNSVERPFKRDLEHSLWVALRPGNMGAGLITTLQRRHSEQEIIAMLKEMTVPEPGDSEGMIRIKQEVQGLKERILLALDSGRTLSDVFDEIRNQGVLESKIKADTMRLRAEAIRSGDAEKVRETIRQANEIRAKQGLEPMSVPEGFEMPEEESTANETYMEFDKEEQNK